MNLDDAMPILAKYKHWDIKTVNRSGRRVGHSCTIWHGGKRITAQANDVSDAVANAIRKICESTEQEIPDVTEPKILKLFKGAFAQQD